MKMQPTQEQCEEKELLPSRRGQVSFATFHPAWGGYVGATRVEFDTVSTEQERPGRFNLQNWHDGEYPILDDDGVPTEINGCSAMDFILFGLDVLEKQTQLQITEQGDQVKLDPQEVKSAILRLLALPATESKH